MALGTVPIMAAPSDPSRTHGDPSRRQPEPVDGATVDTPPTGPDGDSDVDPDEPHPTVADDPNGWASDASI